MYQCVYIHIYIYIYIHTCIYRYTDVQREPNEATQLAELPFPDVRTLAISACVWRSVPRALLLVLRIIIITIIFFISIICY